jgi:hypothetical protein
MSASARTPAPAVPAAVSYTTAAAPARDQLPHTRGMGHFMLRGRWPLAQQQQHSHFCVARAICLVVEKWHIAPACLVTNGIAAPAFSMIDHRVISILTRGLLHGPELSARGTKPRCRGTQHRPGDTPPRHHDRIDLGTRRPEARSWSYFLSSAPRNSSSFLPATSAACVAMRLDDGAWFGVEKLGAAVQLASRSLRIQSNVLLPLELARK